MAATAPVNKLALASQYLEQGRASQAKPMLQQHLTKNPSDVQALRMLRHAHALLGEHEPALYYAQKAQKLAPDNPDMLNIVGNSLTDLGRLDEAEAVLRRAHELLPAHLQNAASLANVLARKGDHEQAIEVGLRPAMAAPHAIGLMRIVSTSLLHVGRADHAVELLKQGAAAMPADPLLLSLLCHASLFAPNVPANEIAAAHYAFGRLIQQQMPQRIDLPARDYSAGRPLILGLIGAEFRACPSAHALRALVDHIDLDAFHLRFFHASSVEDSVTARLRETRNARFTSIVGIPPLAIAERIVQQKVDVLIDLSGHASPSSLLAMHVRPAPVQISWLGYPHFTGVPAITARITDATTDPDTAKPAERLIRLDAGAFACSLDPAMPATGPLPAESAPARAITYGVVTDPIRLNEEILAVYAACIKRTPGSRLLIKNPAVDFASGRSSLTRRLELAGLTSAQFELEGSSTSREHHLGIYHRMDIALDTFPAPNPHAAIDALAMGVPVVTLAGATGAQRTSVPVLHAAGLDALVAKSADQFITAAAGLASDLPRLAGLRAGLRHTLTQSALCDAKTWTRAFEAAIRALWAELPAKG